MKLSEIREKFPQYNDLSDDALIIGLHKKFYSDIPIGKFTQKIEYDTAQSDPTEGMSGADKFLAGTGKAFTDFGRGIGQMVGAVDRSDVADSRKRDAPLMRTGAGLAGNITGNVAALLPTALIPGANTYTGAALIGAGTGLASPSTSTGETLQNVALGGVLAPATIGAVRGGQAVYQAGKGLTEPFTKAGQDRIAAEVLRRSATDPAKAAQMAGRARELVPGSQSTLAQVAQDPGLAQLERTVLNNPEYAPALQSRFGNQRMARLDAVQDMAKAIQPQLESLMRRPSIQSAMSDAKRLAAESDKTISFGGQSAAANTTGQTWKDFTAGKMGEYMRSEGGHGGAMKRLGAEWTALKNGSTLAESAAPHPMNIEALDWLKKALDNKISMASQPGSSIGKEELRGLVQTKSDLMATIEQLAPAYKEANQNFAAMSGQVNSMDVARSLLEKLNKPGSQYMQPGTAREMGDAYSGALSRSFDSVKKATGMNKDIRQVMSKQDIDALENVARDLGRKSFAETAGAARGSPTAQNLLSQNFLRRTLGPTGLPETWAESTMLQGLLSPLQFAGKVSGADKKVMDRIAQGLLDPMDGISLLSRPAQIKAVSLLGAPSAQRYLPAVGLLANGER
jgi:hypothetical protein